MDAFPAWNQRAGPTYTVGPPIPPVIEEPLLVPRVDSGSDVNR